MTGLQRLDIKGKCVFTGKNKHSLLPFEQYNWQVHLTHLNHQERDCSKRDCST